jgi:hypothetical protein
LAGVPAAGDGAREGRRKREAKGHSVVTLAHFLVLGAILFAISVVGIFLNRKNVIVLLMAIELMLLAVNLRSADRRVGHECVTKRRSRWSRHH